MAQNYQRIENDSSKAIFDMNTLKDELTTLQLIESKKEEILIQKMDEKFSSMKNDNKKLFEAIRNIM